MHQMVLLVLDDVNYCTPVLDAWEKAGVSGITILDSTGLGRVRAASSYRDDFPCGDAPRRRYRANRD